MVSDEKGRGDLLLETAKRDWAFMMPASFIFGFSVTVTALDFLTHPYHFGVINVVGFIFGFICIIIRETAKKTLGKYFSYGLKTFEDHNLVKSGIYKYVRHPGYLGMFFGYFSIVMVFNSFYGFSTMLFLIPLILYRIRIEEKMLIEKFGEDYRDYMKKTKKLIPYLY